MSREIHMAMVMEAINDNTVISLPGSRWVWDLPPRVVKRLWNEIREDIPRTVSDPDQGLADAILRTEYLWWALKGEVQSPGYPKEDLAKSEEQRRLFHTEVVTPILLLKLEHGE